MRPADGSRASVTDRLADALARSAPGRRVVALREEMRHRAVPRHWSNAFGVVTAACLLVVVVSGLALMFFYTPSSEPITYHGGYRPLDGITMSRAYRSVLDLSFSVRGGLLLRQVHHWSALLLPASVTVQLVVTFLTAGFRRPRQWAWLALVGVFVLVLVAGWSGYALPDDMLAGTGLRIVEGIMVAIPVVGSWASALLFGGAFPGTAIEHLYPVHLVASAALLALAALRARVSWVHRPAQFPGRGRRDGNVVGIPMYPDAATRALGLAATVAGILVLVGATVTIAPVWSSGPSSPADAAAGSQPDWYTGFLDGALRLVPPGWELVVGGRTLTLAVLVPLVVVGAFVLLLTVYPFIENWAVGDPSEHHLLQRPRDTPQRTAIGVAGVTFYGVLWAAASADVVALEFGLSIETVVHALQVLLLAGPVVGFVVAQRICIGLQRRDADALLHGFETGRIVRLPGGRYVEVYQSLPASERARIGSPVAPPMVVVEPDDRGRVALSLRVRAVIVAAVFAHATRTGERGSVDGAASAEEPAISPTDPRTIRQSVNDEARPSSPNRITKTLS